MKNIGRATRILNFSRLINHGFRCRTEFGILKSTFDYSNHADLIMIKITEGLQSENSYDFSEEIYLVVLRRLPYVDGRKEVYEV